ncbi:MAG: glycosyltransferase family 1 protein, partial [Thermodesulfovibrionales bacterium]
MHNDRGNNYFLYCRNPFQLENQGSCYTRFSKNATEKTTSYGNTLWLFTEGVRLMKKDGIDIFWGTRQMLPPYLPGKTKKILVVYDLVWHYFPETMEHYNRMIAKFLFKRAIREADHIVTISEATASSLVEIVGVPREKVSLIYPAAGAYARLAKNDSSDYIADKYGAGRDYILTVSTVEPRKNLKTLLRVFSELKGEGLQLLVAGASGWKNSFIYQEYERLGLTERDVKFLGYVPDEDMNRLYSGAQLFVFPSIYEGFGMPVLEAMASGTPVIVSNASSLPEVAGDSGILLDPHDEKGWKEAIIKVISGRDLQKKMIREGLERVKLFSWDESALKMR